MGTREYEPLAEQYRVPIVVTGFEPLDVLEGIRRTVLQLESGPARGGERLPARRARPRATPRRRRCSPTCSRCATGPGAASAMIPDSGWRLSPRYRDFDAEPGSTSAGSQTAESPMCRSGEVLQGLIKPNECAAFGTACTPRNAARRDDGVAARAPARRTTSTGGSSRSRSTRCMTVTGRLTGIDLGSWSCPLPLRDSPTIVIGHGGGGVLSARADRAPVPAGVRRRAVRTAELRDCRPCVARSHGGAPRLHHRLLRRAPAVLPRREHRRPGRQRHGQRPGDERAQAARAVRRLHPRGGPLDGRPRPRSPTAMGAAARRGRGALVTGDTKVVDAGHGDGVYINTAGIGLVPDGRRHPARHGRAPGDVVIVSGDHRRPRHGDHERARGPRVRHRRSRATRRR